MCKISLFSLLLPFLALTQNASLKETQNASKAQATAYVTEAFEGLKIVNFESTTLVPKKDLTFVVAHRFGNLKNGIDTFFGLDDAVTRLNFVYGLSDWINIGVSRSSFRKLYQSSLKYRLVRQSKNGFPVSVVGFNAVLVNTELTDDVLPGIDFLDKVGYTSQILISRKFNRNISLLLAPTVFHEGLVRIAEQDNTQYALGFGARYKITKRWSINADYGLHLNRASASTFHNPLSIGFDLETGGHVFQLHFTNSRGINTNSFLGRTEEDWLDGDVFFGFNLSRNF
jgi:hypothetical protein